MDSENDSSVQTCGLCGDIICNQINIAKHPCLEGYTQYITEPDTLYFYSVLDDGVTTIRKIFEKPNKQDVTSKFHENTNLSIQGENKLSSPVNVELQNVELQKNAKGVSAKQNHVDEEILISEVQSREPLWNLKLPLQQRNKEVIKNLWQLAADALEEKITTDEAKIKFDSLYDTYRRVIRSETSAGCGSAIKDTGKEWTHYNSMEFMPDSCLQKTTISNAEDTQDNFEDNSANTENIESNCEPRNKKRKQDSIDETFTSAIEQFANKICNNINNNASNSNLSLPSIPAEVCSFLLMLGCQLRELPLHKQRQIMKQMLDITYNALEEQYE